MDQQERNRLNRLAKYAAGDDTQVAHHGTHGTLDGHRVQRSYGAVYDHTGKKIETVNGGVYVNGMFSHPLDG